MCERVIERAKRDVFFETRHYTAKIDDYYFIVDITYSQLGIPKASYIKVYLFPDDEPFYAHYFSCLKNDVEFQVWACYEAFKKVLTENALEFPEGLIYDSESCSFVPGEKVVCDYGA